MFFKILIYFKGVCCVFLNTYLFQRCVLCFFKYLFISKVCVVFLFISKVCVVVFF